MTQKKYRARSRRLNESAAVGFVVSNARNAKLDVGPASSISNKHVWSFVRPQRSRKQYNQLRASRSFALTLWIKVAAVDPVVYRSGGDLPALTNQLREVHAISVNRIRLTNIAV